jgi:hypothetical protein
LTALPTAAGRSSCASACSYLSSIWPFPASVLWSVVKNLSDERARVAASRFACLASWHPMRAFSGSVCPADRRRSGHVLNPVLGIASPFPRLGLISEERKSFCKPWAPFPLFPDHSGSPRRVQPVGDGCARYRFSGPSLCHTYNILANSVKNKDQYTDYTAFRFVFPASVAILREEVGEFGEFIGLLNLVARRS